MKVCKTYRTGIDVGSTTAKIAVITEDHDLIFSKYQRHNARILKTVKSFFHTIMEQEGNCLLDIRLTGSAGLGLSKKLKIPFTQEVICTNEVIRKAHPYTSTVIDIGGEDSKMIFLNKGKPPDIKMNGSCAGGTGAFIDQIASLLNLTPGQLDTLARHHTCIYPIASRCGVFAKTDVQNLLSRNVPPADIAASVFHAVAVQCINTLARGFDIKPKIILCGGVFAFLPELVKSFLNVLNISESDRVIPKRPELLPAIGAATYGRHESDRESLLSIREIINKLDKSKQFQTFHENRIQPLFENNDEFRTWKKKKPSINIKRKALKEYKGKKCFLGIDSGSTTTKIVVIGNNKEILFNWYQNNSGTPIKTLIKGLLIFKHQIEKDNPCLDISRTAVAGYGEDLIRTAFGIDKGIVETIAHYEAAKYIEPKVSFVLDIGGQDMKALFINNGIINRIELNEACSSGCGSFIETFADSLDFSAEKFGEMACEAEMPCDLGTRCTVFMNSKVKQALRENASIEEISAGLSYSVIKNCLFKVLKLNNMSLMGDNIVLQGGTFKNPSIVRALEILSGKNVKYSDIPELMGAFGAALVAHKDYQDNTETGTTFTGLLNLEQVENYKTKQINCQGCENNCSVTTFTFPNNKKFYSGNKCTRFYSINETKTRKGFNFPEFKNKLLFDKRMEPNKNPLFTIGIARCLNMFENFPFWHTLFTQCNINIRLSSPSTIKLYEKGMGTIMSDSICFPAKLAHGHIYNLAEQNVDRIFYPIVVYENNEFKNSVNSFNCPIVSSYADVINSAVNPEKRFNIPFDKPVVTFHDRDLLKKICKKYLQKFGVDKKTINKAFENAVIAQKQYKKDIRTKAKDLICHAEKNNNILITLAGRPYHIDPLINHKTPEILSDFGIDTITEDAVGADDSDAFKDIRVITQWSYPNRLYNAADFNAKQHNNFQLIQINSFGCGPDAIVTDEVKEILKTGGKNHTLIKVDEISSIGSVKLRLRSMVESLKNQKGNIKIESTFRPPIPRFGIKDKNRKILAPFFAEDYSPYLPAIFKNAGYHFEILPKPDRESVELGLRYSNHDICYPATIVIGDIIKALKSNKYENDKIAIGITQTGGQCRATSYLSLIRKAMIDAGFGDVPIVSVTAAQGLIDQPGFEIDWLRMTKILFITTMFADCIAKMYYATVVREVKKGESKRIKNFYINELSPHIETSNYGKLFQLLNNVINDFNNVEINNSVLPKIGIVGEIYAKYNYFGNQHLADWLIEHNVEPVLPPIVDFFTQDLINYKKNIESDIRNKKISDMLGYPIELFINKYHKKIETMFSKFRFYTPFYDIYYIAEKAGQLLSMTNQFGEGWLVAGEISCFADQGINYVVSLQPFGCIANHIISKGIETKIKSIYPDMNLLFLDFDAGTSEVNIHNRLHFMVENVKAVHSENSIQKNLSNSGYVDA
jgi:predicted CoA-substrate-specific enzyme activase